MNLHQPIDRAEALPPTRGAAGESAWSANAAPAPDLPVLADNITTDVLVIGGGVAGLSTALHLAKAEIDVVLIEGGAIGSGATGVSGGLIAPDYIRHTPETIGAVFGRAGGERVTRFIGHSAQATFDLIAAHGIECDSAQDGFWSPAHTEALANSQRAYAAQWSSRGFDVAFVERPDAQAALGTDRYCGGLRFARGGSLNPLAYARGLASAADRAGARLFVRSPVEALERVGAGWRARCPLGTINARRVVLAANGGNAALHPALQRTVLPLSVIEFVTAPLADDLRAQILPGGGSFTDKTPYVFTARYDGLGQLISAFPGSFLIGGAAAMQREARRRLTRHFTALPAPEIRYLWEGKAWINPSFLPELYDLGDDAIAIQACNGRGLSINTMLGVEVAAALASGSRDALSVRPRAPGPIRLHGLAALLPRALMSLAYLSSRG